MARFLQKDWALVPRPGLTLGVLLCNNVLYCRPLSLAHAELFLSFCDRKFVLLSLIVLVVERQAALYTSLAQSVPVLFQTRSNRRRSLLAEIASIDKNMSHGRER